MTDEEINRLHTSLREVLLYIKYSKDKKKLAEMLNTDAGFKKLERSAAEVINVTTNSKLIMQEGKERIDMCQALREIREDEREDAHLEDIKNIMESFQISSEQAMRALKIPEEQFAKYIFRLENPESVQ